MTPRAAAYFKNHVVVNLRLVPSPASAKEANYVYDSFRDIAGGTLEYFNIERGRPRLNLYNNNVSLMYNPGDNPSQLDPFSNEDFITDDIMHDEKSAKQTSLVSKLRSICALPRYSYIENDERFFNGDIIVPFKYALNREGLKFQDKFKLSPCTSDSPFAYISTTDDIRSIKASMRHNFQNFHKVDRIDIKVGFEAVRKLLQTSAGSKKPTGSFKPPRSALVHNTNGITGA